MKKQIIISVATVVVGAGLALAGYGFSNYFKNPSVRTSYVASVGKQKITEDEYKFFLMSTKNSIEQNAGVQSDDDRKSLWESKLENQTVEEYAKTEALKTSTEFVILLDRAKKANFKLGDDEIKNSNDQIDSYVQSLGSGDAATNAFIAQYGLTPAKVKALNLDLSLVQKFYGEELKKITATDEELKKFYDENTQSYKKVTVKHVLFMTIDPNTNQPLPQDKQDDAKKKGEDILAKVKAGSDIAALAKQYSEDGGSKDNGGEYTFGKGEMVKEFEDWSFNAKVGDVGLVQTQYGYHVIRLEKVSGFDDVKETLKTDYPGKKFTDQIEQWKKDSEYTLVKNESVLSNIKVLN